MVKKPNTATVKSAQAKQSDGKTTGRATREKTTDRASRTKRGAASRRPSADEIARPAPVAVMAQAMLDKKAEDVLSLDLSALESTICDHFVIGHGQSARQVLAIADNVEKEMYEQRHENPRRVQGKENAFWIILDYTDVVVHIFQAEYRRFYRLEDLWADAVRKTYHEIPTKMQNTNERITTPQ
ncbi:MAG: ribosome silencing factor [Prevotellaceae bacterium]|jgi:ribosome-associated protein|nr:ribosome silencing factor [Prevotellaceae bacterium]